jgi:hypothetical protein
VGFVAHDREHERGGEGSESGSHFLRFIFGQKTEGFPEGGEWDEGAQAFSGFAGANERAVPDFGRGECAIILEKQGEPATFVVAARAERAKKIIFFGDGVRVAHDIDDGHCGEMTKD